MKPRRVVRNYTRYNTDDLAHLVALAEAEASASGGLSTRFEGSPIVFIHGTGVGMKSVKDTAYTADISLWKNVSWRDHIKDTLIVPLRPPEMVKIDSAELIAAFGGNGLPARCCNLLATQLFLMEKCGHFYRANVTDFLPEDFIIRIEEKVTPKMVAGASLEVMKARANFLEHARKDTKRKLLYYMAASEDVEASIMKLATRIEKAKKKMETIDDAKPEVKPRKAKGAKP